MRQDQFIELFKELKTVKPDSIRKDYIEGYFKRIGISLESGNKACQFFYNELCKAKKVGNSSIFIGEVIVNDEYFAITDRLCYFKTFHDHFENVKELFSPENIDLLNQTKTSKKVISPIINESQADKIIDNIHKGLIRLYNSIQEKNIEHINFTVLFDDVKINNELKSGKYDKKLQSFLSIFENLFNELPKDSTESEFYVPIIRNIQDIMNTILLSLWTKKERFPKISKNILCVHSIILP